MRHGSLVGGLSGAAAAAHDGGTRPTDGSERSSMADQRVASLMTARPLEESSLSFARKWKRLEPPSPYRPSLRRLAPPVSLPFLAKATSPPPEERRRQAYQMMRLRDSLQPTSRPTASQRSVRGARSSQVPLNAPARLPARRISDMEPGEIAARIIELEEEDARDQIGYDEMVGSTKLHIQYYHSLAPLKSSTAEVCSPEQCIVDMEDMSREVIVRADERARLCAEYEHRASWGLLLERLNAQLQNKIKALLPEYEAGRAAIIAEYNDASTELQAWHRRHRPFGARGLGAWVAEEDPRVKFGGKGVRKTGRQQRSLHENAQQARGAQGGVSTVRSKRAPSPELALWVPGAQGHVLGGWEKASLPRAAVDSHDSRASKTPGQTPRLREETVEEITLWPADDQLNDFARNGRAMWAHEKELRYLQNKMRSVVKDTLEAEEEARAAVRGKEAVAWVATLQLFDQDFLSTAEKVVAREALELQYAKLHDAAAGLSANGADHAAAATDSHSQSLTKISDEENEKVWASFIGRVAPHLVREALRRTTDRAATPTLQGMAGEVQLPAVEEAQPRSTSPVVPEPVVCTARSVKSEDRGSVPADPDSPGDITAMTSAASPKATPSPQRPETPGSCGGGEPEPAPHLNSPVGQPSPKGSSEADLSVSPPLPASTEVPPPSHARDCDAVTEELKEEVVPGEAGVSPLSTNSAAASVEVAGGERATIGAVSDELPDVAGGGSHSECGSEASQESAAGARDQAALDSSAPGLMDCSGASDSPYPFLDLIVNIAVDRHTKQHTTNASLDALKSVSRRPASQAAEGRPVPPAPELPSRVAVFEHFMRTSLWGDLLHRSSPLPLLHHPQRQSDSGMGSLRRPSDDSGAVSASMLAADGATHEKWGARVPSSAVVGQGASVLYVPIRWGGYSSVEELEEEEQMALVHMEQHVRWIAMEQQIEAICALYAEVLAGAPC